MTDYTIWNLIQQYVTGNITPRSRRKLEKWMSQNPENRKLVEEVEKIWRLSPEENFAMNVDEEWEQFYQNNIRRKVIPLQSDKLKSDSSSISGLREKRTNRRKRNKVIFLRVAAVILISIFAGYFSSMVISSENSSETTSDFYVMQELVTDSKEKASVSFSDGTEVTLNSASTLRFRKGFDGSTREIYLDGEAYFDVAHNTNQPFIVHTKEATIQVLGTKFNVQAWSEDIQADIAVREGKVSVSSAHQLDQAQETILVKGEFTQVYSGENPLPARKVNVEKHLLWTSGGLFFDNAPLRNVLRQIERRYEVNIRVTGDEELLDVPFTSTFYEADLQEVLNVIAASMELEFRQDGSEIIFSDADSM